MGCEVQYLALDMVLNFFITYETTLRRIIWKAFNKHTLKKHCDQTENEELIIVNAKKQWTEDYKLLEWGSEGLFWEYLEVGVYQNLLQLFL